MEPHNLICSSKFKYSFNDLKAGHIVEREDTKLNKNRRTIPEVTISNTQHENRPKISLETCKIAYDSDVLPYEAFLKCFMDLTKEQKLLFPIERWHRIFHAIALFDSKLQGPVLDVASGGGSFYRPFKTLFSHLLPYEITEVVDEPVIVDNTSITTYLFHCERDRLPVASNQYGLVTFCDVIEHLLHDPVWTILELNRVLKQGGHLVISTPNVVNFNRILKMCKGANPGFEIFYKPDAVFERHNREWSPFEICFLLSLLGFQVRWLSTFEEILSLGSTNILNYLRELGLVVDNQGMMGPEIVVVAEKVDHMTLDDDLKEEVRWPANFYGHDKRFYKRPQKFL